MRARALSADFGISFSTVGCWAACGRLWAAIGRHYVAKRCHMMLFGIIYTSRPLSTAHGRSRKIGFDAPITIVNEAKFQGLREIWQNLVQVPQICPESSQNECPELLRGSLLGVMAESSALVSGFMGHKGRVEGSMLFELGAQRENLI